MGRRRKDQRRLDRSRTARSRVSHNHHASRVCRFEQIEPRRLLAISYPAIQVGGVYIEDGGHAEDETPDAFEVTFVGGAPGTQLTELVIDGDKDSNGLLGPLDVFFDTTLDPPGAFGAVGLKIEEQTGIDWVEYDPVHDADTRLTFRFRGFDAGDKLRFTIDVDEVGSTVTAEVEGGEFHDTHFQAKFEADHFELEPGATRYADYYDFGSSALADLLPPDNYLQSGERSEAVHTAGAMMTLQQTPLPITISGKVFQDFDLDNVLDAGEPGLADFRLDLYELVGTDYVPVAGQTTRTNGQGQYTFTDVLPGTYRVVETQKAPYLSIGATPGTVLGQTRGRVIGTDIISDISLVGGEDSVRNDFAEALPVTLSGHVYHDADNDGVREPGEVGIADVAIDVQRVAPGGVALPLIYTAYTQPDGSWSVDNLMPGNYQVIEIHPDAYDDGLDTAGTAGGTAHNPGDLIDGIWLGSGQAGENYDFGELMPARLSGHVYHDADNDGVR
ncbi:MAG: hypothetical protein JXB62_06465, partial [Pirellulales bacterium]|nr:hypothetical protein [Pirellulales bacterium]